MGPTGSGKSTVSHSPSKPCPSISHVIKFIETVTGIHGIVDHNLESFASEIAVYKVSFPELSGSDIHFIDTPGIDDTNKFDVDTFKTISDWLQNTCVVIN